ncbi:hypothetical protein BGZ70_010443 [Mortierella alpina]|uniref:ubiquitinyl hydrolase 1 n=1 Tax=Mortierella alpina TaxID=64518 RepID=A0A9P6J2D8_MORAP|nr:hypothetical protein BGZ70_010443 [Mortierella alpina]
MPILGDDEHVTGSVVQDVIIIEDDEDTSSVEILLEPPAMFTANTTAQPPKKRSGLRRRATRHTEATPPMDAHAEPSSQAQESTHAAATLTTDAQSEPSSNSQELEHAEATDAADAKVQPSRNGKDSRHAQATFATDAQAEPLRNGKESRHAQATLATDAQAEPSRKRNGTRTKQVQTPMAEATTARPSKRAEAQDPSEANYEPTDGRPSKRSRNALSSVQDNIAHVGISPAVQQAGRRRRNVAKSRPSNRVQRSSATSAGVDKITAIVQNQDEQDIEMPLIVTEGSGSSRSSATGAGVKEIPTIVQNKNIYDNEMPLIVAEGSEYPGSPATGRGVENTLAIVQHQDEPNNEMPFTVAEGPEFPGSSATGSGVDTIPANVQHQDEPNNEMPFIVAEGPGFPGSSATGSGVENNSTIVQHQDEPNNEMPFIVAEGSGFSGSSATDRVLENNSAIVQHQNELNNEMSMMVAKESGFPGSSATGRGVENTLAIVQHQDEPNNEMPITVAEGPGSPRSDAEKPHSIVQHYDEPNNEMPLIVAEGPRSPGSSTTSRGVENIPATVQNHDDHDSKSLSIAAEGSGFRRSSATDAGIKRFPATAQHQNEYDGEPGSSMISIEQSPSKHALAADNRDVTRRSQRKIKAAPVDEAAPQQSLDCDEPIEMVSEQIIDPAIVAKKGRGRPRKAARADLICPTNDPTGTPSIDSVVASAPTAEDTVPDAAPRPRGRQQSPARIRIGTKRKETEPTEATAKKPRTKAKTEPTEATTKQPRTKAKPNQRGKTVYEDDDERVYEEAIKDRGVRMWETFPMDSNGCIDKWAEMLGVPMRTLPISEDKECLTFPFDMQELEATGSADRVKAFIFFGPDSLRREPPTGDTDSFAIPFLSQQSVGYGHALDSCASLSFVNIAMNSPEILQNGPAAMQQLRATLDDEEKVQSIKHAWRVFDQSEMGNQVHEVHNRIAVAEDSMDVDPPAYNPNDHMKKTRYAQRKAQAIKQEASAAASTSAGGYEPNDDAFHFTALMRIGGQVWELDSMETEPIKITSGGDLDWHVEVSNYLQSLTKDLSAYQKNYNCRLIAVV